MLKAVRLLKRAPAKLVWFPFLGRITFSRTNLVAAAAPSFQQHLALSWMTQTTRLTVPATQFSSRFLLRPSDPYEPRTLFNPPLKWSGESWMTHFSFPLGRGSLSCQEFGSSQTHQSSLLALNVRISFTQWQKTLS